MSKTQTNLNKTISCNSNGMVISYGDANKHQYVGYNSYVSKIQLEGTTKYQKIEEEFKLNPKQKDLYAKIIYGFKAYTKEEIAVMPEATKVNITRTYTKAQRILRNWKQDITFSNLDNFMLSLFPKSSIVKAMCATTGYIDDLPKEEEIPFKELGVKQQHIIGKLMEFELLPLNFYQLT